MGTREEHKNHCTAALTGQELKGEPKLQPLSQGGSIRARPAFKALVFYPLTYNYF
ncbi:hypothetical protein I79_005335 [Cricetulus griseus]|uniref:Uncharacterized protein n=1 Tax=Cricetulus griseus TaxID=10029 RepID=G3H4X3_CRIGR|nr:hypothetical protein I79_005335 [Cricetulus griseus]